MTNIRFRVPSNFDLKAHIEKNKPGESLKITEDGLAHICDSILYVTALHKDNLKEKERFVSLQSKIMKAVNERYIDCIRYLIDTGVIECDGVYCKDKKSKSYRFTLEYHGTEIKLYTIVSSKMRQRVEQSRYSHNITNEATCKSANHLLKWFKSGKLTINTELADKWIEGNKNEQLRLLDDGYSNSSDKVKDIIHRANSYKIAVESMDQNQFNCKRSENGLRFFSRIVTSKSELRNFLTYDGKPLVSLDIKNSQPYFSLLLFNSNFYRSRVKSSQLSLKQVYPELYDKMEQKEYLNRMRRLCKQRGLTRFGKVDLSKYEDYVLKGILYEKSIDMLAKQTNGKLILSRKEIKKKILTILFDDYDAPYMSKNEIYKLFKANFPTVMQMFSLIKSIGYNELAILLQRIESVMVLDRITKDFNKRYKKAPMFTIHDSILTTEEYVPMLKKEMNRQLEELIGYPPMLEEKILKPDFKE